LAAEAVTTERDNARAALAEVKSDIEKTATVEKSP